MYKEIKEIKKFYNELKNIKYGWHDKRGNLYEHLTDGNFKKDYRMQKISDIKKNNHAICWEMCELERKYFKEHKISHKTIFAILKDNKKMPCHTFLVFEKENKWYWFESSWNNQKGIHEYTSLEEILDYIKNNFSDFTKEKYNPSSIEFYEYKKPLIRKISCNLFYLHCLYSKKIKL